jgi:hypothetical protein
MGSKKTHLKYFLYIDKNNKNVTLFIWVNITSDCYFGITKVSKGQTCPLCKVIRKYEPSKNLLYLQ